MKLTLIGSNEGNNLEVNKENLDCLFSKTFCAV